MYSQAASRGLEAQCGPAAASLVAEHIPGAVTPDISDSALDDWEGHGAARVPLDIPQPVVSDSQPQHGVCEDVIGAAVRLTAAPDDAGDEGLDSEYVEEVLQRAVRSAGSLDDRLRNTLFTSAMARTETVSVLFTAKPLSASLTKWPIRIGFLVCAAVAFASAVQWTNVDIYHFVAGPHFRLAVKELRSGALPASDGAASISHFGLLHDSRLISPPNTTVQGANISANFGEKQELNGFFFQTAPSSEPASDPIRVALERSEDGMTWTPCLHYSKECRLNVPMERGATVRVSWSPHERRLLLVVPSFVMAGVLFVVAFACAVAGNILDGKLTAAAAVLFLEIALFGLSTFGFCNSDIFLASSRCEVITYLVMLALFSLGVSMLTEMYLLVSILFFGVALLCLGVCVLANDSEWVFVFPLIVAIGVMLVVFVFSSCALRRAILRRSSALVQADQQAYDSLWESILQEERTRAEVLVLSELGREAGGGAGGRARQETRGGEEEEVDWTRVDRAALGERAEARGAGEEEEREGKGVCGDDERAEVPAEVEGGGAGGGGEGGLRQRGKEGEEKREESGAAGREQSAAGERQPVQNLDRLYLQAACLSPVLRRKVQLWAAASGGGFPELQRGGEAHREQGRGEEEEEGAERGEDAGQERGGAGEADCKGVVWWKAGMGEEGVRWGKLKQPGRAIEKAVRSYDGGDVSRLLDICRESILFRDIAGLTACLRAILADRSVVVERIKNRFDPAYDSALSAGYRDVALNLRIVTRRTRDLAVETHVCEVQLILLSFFNLKSAEGHKRYVTFRNLRADGPGKLQGQLRESIVLRPSDSSPVTTATNALASGPLRP